MNILQITREFPPDVMGGVAYHSYNLAKEFTKAGHSVTLLTRAEGKDRSDDNHVSTEGIEVIRIPRIIDSGSRFLFDLSVRRFLSNTELLSSIDVIHSHEFIRFDKIDSNVPVVLKVHYNLCAGEQFSFPNVNPLLKPMMTFAGSVGLWPVRRRLERDAIRSSDARIYVSSLARDIYRTRYGVEPRSANHRIVHNGVDTELFYPGSGSPRERSYFLSVGGMKPRKGRDILLEAFRGASGPPLRVVGSSNGVELDRSHNIELLGSVVHDEMRRLYQDSIALIHPALYEPFGNVILESLACGRPVIVSDTQHCGAAELLDDKVSEIVDPRNPSNIRDVIERFCSSDLTLSPRHSRNVAEKHTWTRVAEETLTVLKTLR